MKKKELERVSTIEVEDFMNKMIKANKSAQDLVGCMAKDTQKLKEASEKHIAKALQFTSMTDKDTQDPTPSFYKPPTYRHSNNLVNLFNLKKALNSPRDGNRSRSPNFASSSNRPDISVRSPEDDTTSRSALSRDINRHQSIESTLMIETLKNQVKVMHSEIERRDGIL